MADQEACENKVIDELKARNAGSIFMGHDSDGTLTQEENAEEDAIMKDVLKASAKACKGLTVTIGYETIPGVHMDPENKLVTPFTAPSFHISTQPTSPKGGIEL